MAVFIDFPFIVVGDDEVAIAFEFFGTFDKALTSRFSVFGVKNIST